MSTPDTTQATAPAAPAAADATTSPFVGEHEATTAPVAGEQTATTAPAAEGASATTAEPAKPAEDPRFASKFSALSKRQKLLDERERALKSQETRLRELDSLSEAAKADPVGFLQKFGLTYEGITEHILKEGTAPTAEDKVSQLEQRLRAREEAEAKAKAEAEQTRIKSELAQFKVNLGTLIKGKPDECEFLGMEDDPAGVVMDAMESWWNEERAAAEKEGRAPAPLPPTEDFIAASEKVLEAKARKYVQAKKLKQTQTAAQPQPSKNTPTPARPQGSVTISSAATSDGPSVADDLPDDPEERTNVLTRRALAELSRAS